MFVAVERSFHVLSLRAEAIISLPAIFKCCNTHLIQTPGCVIKSLCNHHRPDKLTKTGWPYRRVERVFTNMFLIARDKHVSTLLQHAFACDAALY